MISFSLRLFKIVFSTTGADGENYELFLDVKQVFLVIILVYITQIAVISYTIAKTKDATKRHELRYKRRCCICVCVVLSFIRIGFRVIENSDPEFENQISFEIGHFRLRRAIQTKQRH